METIINDDKYLKFMLIFDSIKERYNNIEEERKMLLVGFIAIGIGVWLLDRMVRKSDGPMNIKNAVIREKITGSLSDLGEIKREK